MYKKTNNSIKSLVLVLSCLATNLVGFGQGASIDGSMFYTTATNQSGTTVNYQTLQGTGPTMSTGYNPISHNCDVKLEFKYDGTVDLDNDFYIDVHLDLSGSTITGGTFSEQVVLNINYKTGIGNTYKDLSLYRVENVNTIDVKITNVVHPFSQPFKNQYNGPYTGSFGYEDIDEMLSLTIEYSHEYFYNYTNKNISDVHSQFYPFSNELEVRWDINDQCKEYQVEWTFLNNSDGEGGELSPGVLAFDFKNNSSRVEVESDHYYIPLIYESGWVAYRVRGVGRKMVGGKIYYDFGEWSLPNSGKVNQIPVENKFKFDGHEPNLNWQYAINFAEEGKNKKVVSYHDGTLRNRQVVSKINSLDRAVIGETYYDFEGRAAIEILSVPSESPSLDFDAVFNQYNNSVISASDFDTQNGDCEPSSISLSSNSGAAKYYSGNNNYSNFADFIPHANGYPYIQTQYTADQTGRIRKLSGIGEVHRLGGDHEIVNYYENASTNRLERLFGSEVGNKEHYSRNLVRDQNGQYTVSYLDLKGNVIATSILGNSPDNLLELNPNEDYQDTKFSEKIIDELIPINNTPNENNELNISTQKVFLENSAPHLTYDLIAPFYYDDCLPQSTCFNCVYEIDFSFLSECGDEFVDDNFYKKTLGNTVANGSCSIANYVFNDLRLKKEKIPESLYSINKSLRINESAIDYYTDQYLAKNTCLKTYGEFFKEELEKLDFTHCNVQCCGDTTNYPPLIIESIENPYSKEDDDLIGVGFSTATSMMPCGDEELNGEYARILENCNKTVSMCSITTELIKTDFYPTNLADLNGSTNHSAGQYAIYEITNNGTFYTTDVTSIFHINSITTHYSNQNITYYDMYGNVAKVNGVDPKDLSIEDFINYFEPSWAESLLEYHPEYCYTEFCDVITESDDYNFKIAGIDDPSIAIQYMKDMIKCTSSGQSLQGANEDPIWDILPNNYAGAFANKYHNFITVGSTDYNLYSYCDYLANEQLSSSTATYDELVWAYFKSLYISLKNEFIEQWKEDYLSSISCCNDCIGNEDFQLEELCCEPALLSSGYDGSGTFLEAIQFLIELQNYPECCEEGRACSCLNKSHHFSNKTKRFKSTEEVFKENGYDINNHDSLQQTAEKESRNDCCKDFKAPGYHPQKEGEIDESNNWISVPNKGLSEKDETIILNPEWKFNWKCRYVKFGNDCIIPTIKTKPYENPCVQELLAKAQSNAKYWYEKYLELKREAFRTNYVSECLAVEESFKLHSEEKEYHHTLYYYDQANNLVKTIPPSAVDPFNQGTNDADFAAINNDKQNGTYNVIEPDHIQHLATNYEYNSLNQLVSQESPDGGLTYIWYDILGRESLSQNAEQRDNNKLTYTKYDYLNRVIEVGEVDISNILQQPNVQSALNNNHTYYDILWGLLEPNDFEYLVTNQSNQKTQITKTYYDNEFTENSVNVQFNDETQQNLRSRVTGTTIDYDGDGDYEYGTFFSYDIHGNVKELVQHNNDLPLALLDFDDSQQFKKITYEYDLISGNVHDVHYQDGKEDQFHHKYFYDAENRITEVETSSDGVIWNNDAIYFYYDHGPLARLELGDKNVQGIDYAYNIQGWIKGVNSTARLPEKDMGGDGNSNGLNSTFAPDAFSYSLNYHNNDYITNSNAFATPQNSGFANEELFNGNIRSMTASIEGLDEGDVFGTKYRYDQLNRIKSMEGYYGFDKAQNSWGANTNQGAYDCSYKYDPVGNIKHLTRNQKNALIDDFDYNYNLSNNQLIQVVDHVINSTPTSDLESQNSDNYKYDAIGNMTQDKSADIWDDDSNPNDGIHWTLSGKIDKIYNGAGLMDYDYDPFGNRISKLVGEETKYYVRDASGNVLATYSWDGANNTFHLKDQTIYGINRLANNNSDFDLLASNSTEDLYEFNRGHKQFELTNHLSNVLATISDKKVFLDVNGQNEIRSEVLSANDYYPFGSTMPERSFSSNSYRYGFNGKEKDEDISGNGNSYDYGFRIYNPRIAKFLSVDPLAKSYPWYTPYQFAGNKPINCIDLDGMEEAESYTNNGVTTPKSLLYVPHLDDNKEIKASAKVYEIGLSYDLYVTSGGIGITYDGNTGFNHLANTSLGRMGLGGGVYVAVHTSENKDFNSSDLGGQTTEVGAHYLVGGTYGTNESHSNGGVVYETYKLTIGPGLSGGGATSGTIVLGGHYNEDEEMDPMDITLPIDNNSYIKLDLDAVGREIEESEKENQYKKEQAFKANSSYKDGFLLNQEIPKNN